MSDPGPACQWYADGLQFACTSCGHCCSGTPGYVWVTSDEIDRIARHLGVNSVEFHRKYVRRVGFGRSLLEKPGGDCEFLQRLPAGKTACTIHPVRPVQCRTWPFWKSNVASPESWSLTAADCPGIGHGDTHPLPFIDAALLENGSRPL